MISHDIKQTCSKKVRWLEDLKKQPKSTTNAICEVRIMGTDEERTGAFSAMMCHVYASHVSWFQDVSRESDFRNLSDLRHSSCAFYRCSMMFIHVVVITLLRAWARWWLCLWNRVPQCLPEIFSSDFDSASDNGCIRPQQKGKALTWRTWITTVDLEISLDLTRICQCTLYIYYTYIYIKHVIT